MVDSTAIALCQENGLPIVVFDMLAPGNIRRVVCGEQLGTVVADVVGPVCETGDFLARDRELANVMPGDLVAICTAGAYGFAQASNYNARPRPAEVLVDGGAWRVVRQRETYEDLVRGE